LLTDADADRIVGGGAATGGVRIPFRHGAAFASQVERHRDLHALGARNGHRGAGGERPNQQKGEASHCGNLRLDRD